MRFRLRKQKTKDQRQDRHKQPESETRHLLKMTDSKVIEVTLVTGAASGIGRECALELAENGANLLLWDIAENNLQEREQELRAVSLSIQIHTMKVDVSDHSACLQAIAAAHAKGLLVKHVIAAAGLVRFNSLLSENISDAALVMAVNYNGIVNTMAAVHADLIECQGNAVLIGSTESYTGGASLHAYAASKHAVLGYGRSAAMELGPKGVRVNTICPGIVRTAMYNPEAMGPAAIEMDKQLQSRIPLKRICEPREVAKVARFLLSKDASYITGAAIVVDGGMTV
jgi:NAD(P)-dependent dehydrogenase (short-subunit alcohol dehydrogenase family)